jgi:hypothetical protein
MSADDGGDLGNGFCDTAGRLKDNGSAKLRLKTISWPCFSSSVKGVIHVRSINVTLDWSRFATTG